jgi:hypothetical protein
MPSPRRREPGSWAVVLVTSALLTFAVRSCSPDVSLRAGARVNGHACAVALHVARHANGLDARCM